MPFDRRLYPSDWSAISLDVRARSHGRCECEGECGRGHHGRCEARQGGPAPVSGKRVVLTVAHLWRGPCAPCAARDFKCGEPGHLKAMCQACHLIYDLPHHVARRRRNRHAARATGDLFQPLTAREAVG